MTERRCDYCGLSLGSFEVGASTNFLSCGAYECERWLEEDEDGLRYEVAERADDDERMWQEWEGRIR